MSKVNCGEELAHISTGLSTFLFKYGLMLMPVAIFTFGVFLMRSMLFETYIIDGIVVRDYGATDFFLAFFMVIFGLAFAITLLFCKRGRSVAIYECGAVIKYGIIREISFTFDVVKAIRGDRIYFNKDQFSRRHITILLSKKARKALDDTISRYLVKDLTKDNLKEANIYFGKHLWLKDGVIYSKWTFRNVKALPLDEFDEAERVRRKNDYAIFMYSSKNPNFWLVLSEQYIANQMLLFWIADILHDRPLRESVESVWFMDARYRA